MMEVGFNSIVLILFTLNSFLISQLKKTETKFYRQSFYTSLRRTASNPELCKNRTDKCKNMAVKLEYRLVLEDEEMIHSYLGSINCFWYYVENEIKICFLRHCKTRSCFGKFVSPIKNNFYLSFSIHGSLARRQWNLRYTIGPFIS